MRALSIRQPWAWLIVAGHKDVENRDWSTGYRGPVLIHASKRRMTLEEWDDFYDLCEDFEIVPPVTQDMLYGGIVGVAKIVDCVTSSESPWFTGRCGFVLDGARKLPFLACKGQLGLFEATYDLPAAIAEAIS